MNPVPGYTPLPPKIDVPSVRDMTRAELAKREEVIAIGKEHFIAVGEALQDIKDRKGYRFDYPTFETYCQKRWGFSRQRAQQYTDAVKTIEVVVEVENVNNLFTSESQARDVKTALKDNGKSRVVEVLKGVIAAPNPKKALGAALRALKAEGREQKREKAQARVREHLKTAPQSLPGVYCADARTLGEYVPAGSVQLIVTSPQYNAGIKYDVANDNLDPFAYAELLENVFTRCYTALCDGGRILCVVPFGVNRDPYVPVAPLVMDHLCAVGFTLRGQIVWHKGTFDSNTAWGSRDSFTNPVLRDTNECIIVAHKGNAKLEAPEGTLVGGHSLLLEPKDFALLTTDFWPIPPVRDELHPCPFPVRLVENAIKLYGYKGCRVLDPFMGVGSTLVAAQGLGCEGIGFDISEDYCARTRQRLSDSAKERLG